MSVVTGVLDWFGEAANREEVLTRTVEHVGISALALGVACAVAVPLALWLGHTGRGGTLAVQVSNVGRAVPTFALLAILFLVLGGVERVQLATVLALVLFAVPPILTNGYVGVREVDREVVEAARGAGMGPAQVLRQVELPLAVPLLMTGVRLAAVQVVATATIAGLLAGPGLGRVIASGFARQDQDQVVAGAVVVVVLALAVEGGSALLQARLDPVRRARRVPARARRSATVTPS